MIQLKDFLLAGVYQTKIIETDRPMFAWNMTKKRIVLPEDLSKIDENGKTVLKMFEKNGRLFSDDYKDNIHINLFCYSELTQKIVDEINNSEDRAIMMNDNKHYRFKIIPTKEYVDKHYIKLD